MDIVSTPVCGGENIISFGAKLAVVIGMNEAIFLHRRSYASMRMSANGYAKQSQTGSMGNSLSGLKALSRGLFILLYDRISSLQSRLKGKNLSITQKHIP